MDLTPSAPKREWLDRFTRRLGELVKEIGPQDGFRLAERVFVGAAVLEPEDAATVCADRFYEETGPSLAPSAPKDEWLARFGQRFDELVKGIDPHEVVRLAETMFGTAAALVPEDVATFVAEDFLAQSPRRPDAS